ncbi:S53 family peptidase [Enhygromyxa salina]|uniref:Pseudomonalisin n=1 Tax=Enhygromyxa salina TaxID=215803 RepID=A0A2S9YNA1_9BACT|nr:S53 family serine peptidase [Enhygromyxa salina]PRQ06567.1 Pseudomonalisin precursor [Enhygromyxa salina]
MAMGLASGCPADVTMGGDSGGIFETSASDGDAEAGSGDSDAGDSGDGASLEDVPEAEWEEVPKPSGIPQPLPGVYEDQGPADLQASFRSLLGLVLRDRTELADFVLEVSNPASDLYGDYMSTQELLDNHAPTPSDLSLLQAWLEHMGLSANYLATSRQLIQFSGTVRQFNEAFGVTLHLCMRKNPQFGGSPFPVYCLVEPMTMPLFVATRSTGVVTADLPAELGQLPNEIGEIMTTPPPGAESGSRLTPERVARAYDFDILYAKGYDGAGQKIGVVMGAQIHTRWAQTFWQTWGITRANPQIFYTAEDPVTRFLESQLDTTWAGALAPGAEIIGYEGPDARNTSMVFAYTEACARAQADGVSVVTTSFAHREDSEPRVLREQYDDAALVGAALGLTLFAASGDSGRTDTPSSSPWVTGVGGTRLYLDGAGDVIDETAWDGSGSGITISFDMPPWQVAVAGNIGGGDRRVVADVSAAASPASPYWVYFNSDWSIYGGTSFSAPVWAAMVAVVNQYRDDEGMAPVGYLNQALYLTPAVQATFRDVVDGATADFSAGHGWDVPSGWGSPSAAAFADALPSP